MQLPGRRAWKLAGVGVLLILATLLVVQNTEVVTIRFLAWEITLSRILLLGGALAIGFGLGYLTSMLRARRARSHGT